jgi:hypothetical protein
LSKAIDDAAPSERTSALPNVRHSTVQVGPANVFYREAGTQGQPVLLLLHGFANSSHYFRHLMPKLGGRFHLIAPEWPSCSGRSLNPSDDRPTDAKNPYGIRVFGSANGNRTRKSESRPLPSNTRWSFPVRGFAFSSPVQSFRIPASFAQSVRRALDGHRVLSAGFLGAVLRGVEAKGAAFDFNASPERARPQGLRRGGVPPPVERIREHGRTTLRRRLGALPAGRRRWLHCNRAGFA